ncbi:MAG: hypothetical protein LBH13_06580 [Cellulomonadaceae bacterium]|jgi:predicted  nucleic acid-binding Zn-ribbon protein|nr:hypothetical protein [Cellulomonadaceae bacterium]
MSDSTATFTPPESQEALDSLINAQVEAERAKYAGFDDFKAKAAKFDAKEAENLTELQKATQRADDAEAKVAAWEQAKQVSTWAAEIVKDTAVPADALRGSTKEELQAHFEQLKPLVAGEGRRTHKPVGGSGEGGQEKGRAAAALRDLMRSA